MQYAQRLALGVSMTKFESFEVPMLTRLRWTWSLHLGKSANAQMPLLPVLIERYPELVLYQDMSTRKLSMYRCVDHAPYHPPTHGLSFFSFPH